MSLSFWIRSTGRDNSRKVRSVLMLFRSRCVWLDGGCWIPSDTRKKKPNDFGENVWERTARCRNRSEHVFTPMESNICCVTFPIPPILRTERSLMKSRTASRRDGR